MEMKSLSLKNSTITYIDKGAGKPIVLLHGFCGSSEYWSEVIPVLSENYRVIAPDLPGHGGSVAVLEDYSISDIADMLKELLDQLNLDKVTMFGHSLGGYITLAFAEKYNDSLNGFSLVHSTAFPDSDEAKQGRTTNIEKVKKEGIKSLIDGLVPKLFSPDHLENPYVENAKEIGYRTPPEGAISSLSAMRDRPDRNQVLKSTSLPVLLIAGEKDQVIAPEKTFSVSKENIKQTIIKDSGHMSMYENPTKLIMVMKDFLV
ncbi:alpha/beta fold hydrolase [Neobacillus cucumis]|uniref:alpha/beta fold hydrolase n=1 Tax=Neobacillus cucumis TaxID=1740721 RepID=UPI00285357FD|nr:alpha/beta hydrolase [Neobacillus cucumis]MDR4947546.1 alpha/beta hydrolase [Neobacillus cucumis]